MKHPHPHHPHPHDKVRTLSGTYRQPIYSPDGEIEGLLLEVDGAPTQIVLEAHEPTAVFEGLHVGQQLQLEAALTGPSPKGEAVHAVYRFHDIVSVDGKKPAAPTRKLFKGRVVRLNYARHGEPNGVVLDSGDFIHLRPQGFRDSALKLGDAVQAEGEARPMAGGGFVVEAVRVNDAVIEPKKPKPPKPHGGPKQGPKHEARRHVGH
jgi:hypothetical protein